MESLHTGRVEEAIVRLLPIVIALAALSGCTVPNYSPYSSELITGSIAPPGPFADRCTDCADQARTVDLPED